MSDSLEAAALVAASHIVMNANPSKDIIESTAQTAVKLLKAYREATAAARTTADYSDLMRPKKGK